MTTDPIRQPTVREVDTPLESDFDTLSRQIDPLHGPKHAFLMCLRHTGSARRAAKIAKVPRSTYRYWLKHDEIFKGAYEAARADAAELLVEAARERAINGVKRIRPIFYQGEHVGDEIWVEYSDKLLQFLIQTEAGQDLDGRYSNARKIEHTGEVDVFMRLAEKAEADQERMDLQLQEGNTVDGEVREVQPDETGDVGI